MKEILLFGMILVDDEAILPCEVVRQRKTSTVWSHFYVNLKNINSEKEQKHHC